MLGLIAVVVVLIAGMVWFWVEQPTEPTWGNSSLFPRILAAVTIPVLLYTAYWGLWALLQPEPVLVMDSSGLVSKTQPPRTRQVSWEDISNVEISGSNAVKIHTVSGHSFKVFSVILDNDWASDELQEIIEEFRVRFRRDS